MQDNKDIYWITDFVIEHHMDEPIAGVILKECKINPLDSVHYVPVNLEEQGKRLGLKVFDCSLPQQWVDDVTAKTGQHPSGLVVWCYDNSRNFGEPVGISRGGEMLLKIYKHICENK